MNRMQNMIPRQQQELTTRLLKKLKKKIKTLDNGKNNQNPYIMEIESY